MTMVAPHGRREGLARHDIDWQAGALRIWVHATTLRSLFEQTARAVAEVLGVAEKASTRIERHLHVEGPDRGSLLLAWLNELIGESEKTGAVFTEPHILSLSASELDASVAGFPIARDFGAGKAVLRAVHLRSGSYGHFASIILEKGS